MNTNFALLARFETPIVNLKDVCQEFFGYTIKTSMQKIKGQDFPVPTFRLVESERSPVFVKIEDLALYIDKCHSCASQEWNKVHAA
jgi:hypothetical protein